MDEWQALDQSTQAVLEWLIERAGKEGGRVSEEHKGDELYAYRLASGRIAWGVNSGETGINVARGTKEQIENG